MIPFAARTTRSVASRDLCCRNLPKSLKPVTRGRLVLADQGLGSNYPSQIIGKIGLWCPRQMSTSHEQRTAAEPRENEVHDAFLSEIININEDVRLLHLRPSRKSKIVRFLPGQWMDLFIPGLSQAGGFTITSTPEDAQPKASEDTGYVELAVQKSNNPASAWLWQPERSIIGSPLRFRVGGSFVWPPPKIRKESIENLLLVAGGVGINPLISILSHLNYTKAFPPSVSLIYSVRMSQQDVSHILFLDRLNKIFCQPNLDFRLFLTGDGSPKGDIVPQTADFPNLRLAQRRFVPSDLIGCLPPGEKRHSTVAYVCGPPAMTDEVVAFLSSQEGMSKDRVLCEKWW